MHHSSKEQHDEYRSFWENVGENFPSLKGATSTHYYFECEKTLLKQYFPHLNGRSFLKTDLWDEAKNTEILRWAAENGVRPFGVDIALSIAKDAREILSKHRPGLVVSDLKALPFSDGTFDLIYSMGTIEHLPDYKKAIREIHHVLKAGGRAIIGVPNKLDPFLRPLLVRIMSILGIYAYGKERSFSTNDFCCILESEGFRVIDRSGILFMPGWLRMLDLWFYTHIRPFAKVTGWLVKPFALIYKLAPFVRRHGYLIAIVVEKA